MIFLDVCYYFLQNNNNNNNDDWKKLKEKYISLRAAGQQDHGFDFYPSYACFC